MKKLFVLLALATIISCSKEKTKKDLIKDSIESYFLNKANDPKSYEFVDLKNVDTIYKKEYYSGLVINYQALMGNMKNYPSEIKENLDFAKKFRKYKSESDALRAEKYAKELQDNYDKVKNNLSKFKKLLDSSEDGEIFQITANFSCRANNSYGAKTLNTYKVVLNDSLLVKSMKNLN